MVKEQAGVRGRVRLGCGHRESNPEPFGRDSNSLADTLSSPHTHTHCARTLKAHTQAHKHSGTHTLKVHTLKAHTLRHTHSGTHTLKVHALCYTHTLKVHTLKAHTFKAHTL